MATTQKAPGGARVHVQKFGTFLSNMVLPNIGAFIAWGLITALFIKTGWITLIGGSVFGYEPGELRLRRAPRRLGRLRRTAASSGR